MTIAVDFDGTIVTNQYPSIGVSVGAVPVIHVFQKLGFHVYLYTCRQSTQLDDALEWCSEHQIPLTTNQCSTTDNPHSKQYYDVLIDDHSFGCPITVIAGQRVTDWTKVAEWLFITKFISLGSYQKLLQDISDDIRNSYSINEK